MKIIQNGRSITADFTDIENQFSAGTVIIPVEFNDTTFEGYQMFYSAQLQNFETYNYIAKLVDNNIVIPLAVTYYQGTITISIYGIKGDLTLTTNNIAFNIIESNPTADQVKPVSTDWAQAVKEYTDAYAAEKYSKIIPTINPESKHWHIGGVDTGVLAEGHVDIRPATKNSVGGVSIGDGLIVSVDGKVSVAKKIELTKTLNVGGWNSKIYDLAIPEVKQNSIVKILPIAVTRPEPTQTELENNELLSSSGFQDAGQTQGHIFIYAETPPSKDVQIRVIVEEN